MILGGKLVEDVYLQASIVKLKVAVNLFGALCSMFPVNAIQHCHWFNDDITTMCCMYFIMRQYISSEYFHGCVFTGIFVFFFILFSCQSIIGFW